MKTKKLLFVILFFVSVNSIYGQGPAWEWAKSIGETNYGDDVKKIATDAHGNVYITGPFISPTITFGNITLFNDSDKKENIYLAKYDAHGNVIWAKSIGGNNWDESIGMAIDASENIYLNGIFYSDSIVIDSTLLLNSSTSTFLIKFDSNGKFLWTKSVGNGASYGPITSDSYSNLYVEGSYYDSLRLDSIVLKDPSHGVSSFLVKYDSNGNVQWAKSFITENIGFTGMAITGNNLYVTGAFSVTALIDTIPLIGNIGWHYTMVARFDTIGNLAWAKSAGGLNFNDNWGCVTDADENVYIGGSFTNTGFAIDSITLTNAGDDDIFIAKYNKNGKVLWAKSAGGKLPDRCFSIASDGKENIFLTGYYNSDTIHFGNVTLTSLGGVNVFVVQYDSAGNPLWAKTVGGSRYQEGLAIAADTNDNVFVSGAFEEGTIVFGSFPLTNNHTGSGYIPDIFLAKLSSTVGINELFVSNNLFIYPNPAHHTLTVTFNTPTAITYAALYDLTGRMILEKGLTPNPLSKGEGANSHTADIDVSGVAAGVYVVRVGEERGMVVIE